MQFLPALGDLGLHAQRVNHFGIAAATFYENPLLCILFHRLGNRILRRGAVYHGNHHNNQRSCNRYIPKPRVDQKDDTDKDRNPWQVKQAQDRRA